jgi:hypothetical protein
MKKSDIAKLERAVKEGHKAQNILEEIKEKQVEIDNRSMVGNCYRYRNSYGGDSKWWLYGKILAAAGARFKALKFQKYSNGQIEISFDGWFTPKGWENITANEYSQAWSELQRDIATLGAYTDALWK